MENIKHNMTCSQMTLDQYQRKGPMKTVTTFHEDLGRTNFVPETKDARSVRKGKEARRPGVGRSGSKAIMSDMSGSESDGDELNIHANSTLPGTPAVPVSRPALSSFGLPYVEGYMPKSLPSFKKTKNTKSKNDENSPDVVDLSSPPRRATRSQRQNHSSARPLKSSSSVPSNRQSVHRSDDMDAPEEITQSEQIATASSRSAGSSSNAAGSSQTVENPLDSMLEQKKLDEVEESQASELSDLSLKPSKRPKGTNPKGSQKTLKSSCPIDDLWKGEKSPYSSPKKRKTKSSAMGDDNGVCNEQEGSTRSRSKGKGKASESSRKPPEIAPFPLELSPHRDKEKSDGSSTLYEEPKSSGSKMAPFPLEFSPARKMPSSSGASFTTPVGREPVKARRKESTSKAAIPPRKLIPFPLQKLSPPSSSQQSTKRSSDEDLPDSSPTKRMKSSGLDVLEDYSLGDDFSFTQDVKADPKTICPFCDLPFPSDPSPLLQQMLRRARSRSYRDPRPSNRLGLKADMTVFIDVCQRHRFEVEQLPKATAHGWPKKIDFDRLPERIESLRRSLERVINDKERSVFWKELKKNIEKDGLMKTVGLAGQMNAFQNCQPGYYGELGSMIINQTLCTMFPPETLRSEKIAPLPVMDFLQRVLIPEVAIALVMDDMAILEDEALTTLRESSSYGAAMFPVTDMDEGGDEVHDKLVKKRARAKRKEIEETEGLLDSDAAKQTSSEHHKQEVDATPKPKKPASKRTHQKKGSNVIEDTASVVDLSDSAAESDTTSRSSRSTKASIKTSSSSRQAPSSSQTSQASLAKPSSSLVTSSENMQTPRPRPRPRPKPRQPAQSTTESSSRPPWEAPELDVKAPQRKDRAAGAMTNKSYPLAMAKSRAQKDTSAITSASTSTTKDVSQSRKSSSDWYSLNMWDKVEESGDDIEQERPKGRARKGGKLKEDNSQWLLSSQDSEAI